jgi:hypothetical protein
MISKAEATQIARLAAEKEGWIWIDPVKKKKKHLPR